MENLNTNTITIADLDIVRNVINVAATRGAFRADEMQKIGEIYNKLSSFLETVVQQAQQEAEKQEAQDQAENQPEQSQGE